MLGLSVDPPLQYSPGNASRLTIYHILRLLLLKITRDLHGLNDTCTPFVSTDLNSMSFLCAWLLAAHGHTVKCDGQRVLIHSTGTVYIWQDLAHLSTLLGSNISPTSRHFWVDDVPFPVWWHMWLFPAYYCSNCLGFRFRVVSALGPGKRLKKELLGRQSSWAMWVPSLGGRCISLGFRLPESGGYVSFGECTLNDWFWKFLFFPDRFFSRWKRV